MSWTRLTAKSGKTEEMENEMWEAILSITGTERQNEYTKTEAKRLAKAVSEATKHYPYNRITTKSTLLSIGRFLRSSEGFAVEERHPQRKHASPRGKLVVDNETRAKLKELREYLRSELRRLDEKGLSRWKNALTDSEVMPAQSPSHVEGPPYTTSFPFYQTEALAFFTDKEEMSLPYTTNSESISLVRRLYSAGAAKVDAVVTGTNTAHPIVRELEVFLPKARDSQRVHQILDALCRDAKREGRLIQVGAGDIPTPVNVWWEDI